MSDAAARLLELIQIRLVSAAISAAATHGIADLLADGPKTVDQLAASSGVDAGALARLMRALVHFDVFAQDAGGRFALAPMSEFLKREAIGSLRPAALFFGGEAGTSTARRIADCVKTGESASRMLAGRPNWIEWIQHDLGQADLFNAVMTSFAALHFTGVLDAYDFGGAADIVDVGGGYGKILSEILKRYPRMRGTLFEMPHAIDGGLKTMAAAGLSDRCEVVSGDFFVSVPAGAERYLLSRVLHDWDDDQSVAILKVIRRAIAPHGRLVVLETMLRPDGTSDYPVLSDLNMLVITDGMERTEDQYRALYHAAGFELTRAVVTPAPTGTCVIEGTPR